QQQFSAARVAGGIRGHMKGGNRVSLTLCRPCLRDRTVSGISAVEILFIYLVSPAHHCIIAGRCTCRSMMRRPYAQLWRGCPGISALLLPCQAYKTSGFVFSTAIGLLKLPRVR